MSAPGAATERTDTIRLFLLLLLAADVAFFGVHLVHVATPYLPARPYSIEADGGFSEWYQYVKEFWVVILAGILWRRTGNRYFAGWMLLYAYLLCDDSFSVHELAGDIAYRHLGFGPALGLRALDFGELLVNGLMGLAFLVLIGSGYRKADRNAQGISRDLTMLFVVLVAFGVGLDTLHSVITNLSLRHVFGLLEDGGEMVTMSVTCWYMLAVVDRNGLAPVPLLVERARTALSRR
jgi:hypothetical protein